MRPVFGNDQHISYAKKGKAKRKSAQGDDVVRLLAAYFWPIRETVPTDKEKLLFTQAPAPQQQPDF